MNAIRRQRWKSNRMVAVVVALCTSCVGTAKALSILPPLAVSRLHGRRAPPWTTTSSSSGTPLKATAAANHEGAEDVIPSSTIHLRAAVFQPPIIRSSSSSSILPDNDNGRNVSTEPTNPLEGLTTVADVLQMAARCRIDMVQFPELFLHEPPSGRGPGQPLDRESTALNIVGNLCAQLNVACVVGYAEAPHESETRAHSPTTKGDAACIGGGYSSLAVFHADGSRAGNYRSVHPPPEDATRAGLVFDKGYPLLEATPISVRLPTRDAPAPREGPAPETEPTPATPPPREVRLGVLCGGDLLVPEQARYLSRLGAELLAVSGSLRDARAARHLPPARSLENGLPLLFANYVEDDADDDGGDEEKTRRNGFLAGQSAIVSADGTELVRAPETLWGDMPTSDGYLVPCENGGALYAADLEVPRRGRSVDSSMGEWTIAPRINDFGENTNSEATAAASSGTQNGLGEASRKEKPEPSKGFGRGDATISQQNQTKKRVSKRR